MTGPLEDLRVIDFSTEIAGPYATKLFVDAGAEVIKVESPEGDPLRARRAYRSGRSKGDSPLFRYLNAGKQSFVAASDDPAVQELLLTADLLVESGATQLDLAAIRQQMPNLVILSFSPYGLDGPYVGRPSTPFVVEAESGSVGSRGRADGVPVQIGGRLLEWAQGVYGAVGGLAAVIRARHSGIGEHVDAPLLLAANYSAVGGQLTMHLLNGGTTEAPARVTEIPAVEPSSDGWVGLSVNTHQHLADFLVLIEQPDLLERTPEWASKAYRLAHADEWNQFVHAWTKRHTTAEIIERALLFRLPAAPVNSGADVCTFEQFAKRGVLAPSPDGEFIQPQPPFVVDGHRAGVHRPAPTLDTSSRPDGHHPVERVTTEGRSTQLPFDGLRVFDATAWWAGPAFGAVFAALGADVIHLESLQHPDGVRFVVGPIGTEVPSWWERSGLALTVNANKRDLTLDLGDPEGRALAEELLRTCDVLVENYSPRVFDSFGLTPELVKALNPSLVFVRMPAYGLDGPWRDNVGMAVTMEQLTGLAWRTGHPDDAPRVPRGPSDPIAGYHAAFAAMAALYRRDRAQSGGAFIEAAMAEAIVNCAAEAVVAFTGDEVIIEREGNRSPDAAPQGLYHTQEPGSWLAISVATDTQWLALRSVLGLPKWAEDPVLETMDGRLERQDQIDEHLQSWAARQDLESAVQTLVDAGVPAGPVQDHREAHVHPQFEALNYFETVDHPVVGPHLIAGQPFRYASVGRWISRPAPTLGQHNREILTAVLGLDGSAVEDLESRKVVGTRPNGF